MIFYYYNPKTQDLIMLDSKENEIFIIEKIKEVKVFSTGEIQMGDFSKEDEKPLKKKKGRGKITPEIIAEIKRLKSEMKSGREIAEELGISEPSVWHYLKK